METRKGVEVAAVTDELEQAIAPVCASAGVALVDVELRQSTLQVIVERDGGLDLDAIAEVARAISLVLDERAELVPDAPFELEVSSPGVERRLRRPEHFARAIGELLALRTTPGTSGERRLEGRLVAADDLGVTLRGEDGRERELAYGEIERAHTVFDWRAALRAGSARTDVAEELSEAGGEDEDPDVEDLGEETPEGLDEDFGAADRTPQPAASRRGGQTTKQRESR